MVLIQHNNYCSTHNTNREKIIIIMIHSTSYIESDNFKIIWQDYKALNLK